MISSQSNIKGNLTVPYLLAIDCRGVSLGALGALTGAPKKKEKERKRKKKRGNRGKVMQKKTGSIGEMFLSLDLAHLGMRGWLWS